MTFLVYVIIIKREDIAWSDFLMLHCNLLLKVVCEPFDLLRHHSALLQCDLGFWWPTVLCEPGPQLNLGRGWIEYIFQHCVEQFPPNEWNLFIFCDKSSSSNHCVALHVSLLQLPIFCYGGIGKAQELHLVLALPFGFSLRWWNTTW